MSFLDNLENSLKALESSEQGGIEDGDRREAEQQRVRAAAPWAEKLKRAPWTQALMQQATRAGFERRLKVNLIWIGTALRLEARGHRLELRPQADGITGVFVYGGREFQREAVDLAGDPAKLVAGWMTILDTQKKLDDERAARERAEYAEEE